MSLNIYGAYSKERLRSLKMALGDANKFFVYIALFNTLVIVHISLKRDMLQALVHSSHLH